MSYCERAGSDGRMRLWVRLDQCAPGCRAADISVRYQAELHQLHQQLLVLLQLEEEIQEDLKWCVEVKEVLHSGQSEFQTMELVSSGPFGKVCDVSGKAACGKPYI